MYCSVARTTTYDDGNTTVIVTKCSLEPDNHPDNVEQHDEPPALEFLWGPFYQRSPYLLTKSKEQFLRREPKSSPGSSPGGKGQCPRISSSRRVGEGSSLMNKSYSIVRVHGFWSSMMLTNLNSQNHAWSFLVWTPVHCLPLHMLTPNVPMRENFHLSCLLESPNLERTWMQEHDLHCHTLVEPVPQTQTIQMIHKCLSSLCSPSAMHIAIRW